MGRSQTTLIMTSVDHCFSFIIMYMETERDEEAVGNYSDLPPLTAIVEHDANRRIFGRESVGLGIENGVADVRPPYPPCEPSFLSSRTTHPIFTTTQLPAQAGFTDLVGFRNYSGSGSVNEEQINWQDPGPELETSIKNPIPTQGSDWKKYDDFDQFIMDTEFTKAGLEELFRELALAILHLRWKHVSVVKLLHKFPKPVSGNGYEYYLFPADPISDSEWIAPEVQRFSRTDSSVVYTFGFYSYRCFVDYQYDFKLDTKLCDLLETCMDKDPDKRPAISDILNFLNISVDTANVNS